jgi:hypothetical protein
MDKEVYQEVSLREQLRLKLLDAGALVTNIEIEETQAKILSPDEIFALGQLPCDTPTSTELIDDDRELKM